MKLLITLIVSLGCFIALSFIYFMTLDMLIGASTAQHARHFGGGIVVLLLLQFTYGGLRSKKYSSKLAALLIAGISGYVFWTNIENAGDAIGLAGGTLAAFFISLISVAPAYFVHRSTSPTKKGTLDSPNVTTEDEPVVEQAAVEYDPEQFDNLLKEADKAWNRNDFSAAKKLYQKVVAMSAPCDYTEYAKGRLIDIEEIENRL